MTSVLVSAVSSAATKEVGYKYHLSSGLRTQFEKRLGRGDASRSQGDLYSICRSDDERVGLVYYLVALKMIDYEKLSLDLRRSMERIAKSDRKYSGHIAFCTQARNKRLRHANARSKK